MHRLEQAIERHRGLPPKANRRCDMSVFQVHVDCQMTVRRSERFIRIDPTFGSDLVVLVGAARFEPTALACKATSRM